MKVFPRAAIAVAAAAALLSTAIPVALAAHKDDSGSQLVDISHQVGDMQKKIADLQAKGKLSKGAVPAALLSACGYGDSSQVFLPWADPAQYALAPGGDLSDLSGWLSLKNVSSVADHDPFTPGASALAFAQGDSEAITPAMCVNLENPTIRFFMRDIGGNGKSDLKVDVLYQDLDGHQKHLTLAKLRASGTWNPTLTIPIGVNVLSVVAPGGYAPVAFDFKAEGLQKNEQLELDSLYVDPFAWH